MDPFFILDTSKSFEEASAALQEAVVGQGFGVLAVHDLGPLRSKGLQFPVSSDIENWTSFRCRLTLFKELSRRLQQAGRPDLSRLFNLMARDEARHAGFLNRALVAEGIQVDLPGLSGRRPITWFPLSGVLYSVDLSEKIGYWRYILIDRHLKGPSRQQLRAAVCVLRTLVPGGEPPRRHLQHADPLLAGPAPGLARSHSQPFLSLVDVSHPQPHRV